MVSFVYSGTVYGINSYIICVETDASNGLPAFDMVGMLNSEVREAKERVKVSLKNNGITRAVIIWVARVAIAAPVIPYLGINNKFKIMLQIAPNKAKYLAYFCLPSHTNQNSLTTPTKENKTPNITSLKDVKHPR